MTTTSAPRRRVAAGLIGAAGTLLVLAYAVFAVLQIQVLNPLATMPGSTLGEIRAAVGRTGDSMGWGLMIATLVPGPLLAAALTLAAARGHLSARAMLACVLALLTLGSLAYLFASFPAGMTLADTFMVDGADHSPWGNLLHAISLASLGALMVLGAVSALGGLRRTAQLSATPRPAEIADPRPAERPTER
jgi:hypothetical protein